MPDAYTLAAFDFDGTITTRDSLQDFVRGVAGRAGFAAGVARSAPWLFGAWTGACDRGVAKAHFLSATLGGMTRHELEEAARNFAARELPALVRPEMLERVQEHKRLGHRLVLISASPSIYLRPWAAQAGFDAVLATELEFVGERFSGRLASANCWGPEKVRRLREWLAGEQPAVLYAYGDSRGDRELLALADRPWLRGDGALPALPAAATARPS
ncbi:MULTISPECIES: HAD family hydrolase [unclassified Variovorax]|jgi:phosphatidylglycerophosphatase C|uniref:HAD family hydrolase n=1 Tax=unclassified Variovorax TaxID=663243 RepID=UPI000F7E042E|nr:MULTISPECIES: HAD family hydrolase [unclassified Variovorax]RSZ47434.1 HAD family hydrolase [Variovorax sp. 553]RSZ48441.1 HAD family hydrolase [Variovorax sp. 679]